MLPPIPTISAVRAVDTAKAVMAALEVRGGAGAGGLGTVTARPLRQGGGGCRTPAPQPPHLPLRCVQVPEGALTQAEQLLELDQGRWEGAVRAECFTPELTAAFAADPWGRAWEFTPPGGAWG